MILLTGATGFVGRRVLRILVDSGARVRVLARNPPDVLAHPRVDVVQWAAPEAPPAVTFADVSSVVHLAAFLPPDYADPGYARQCLEVNALGTLHLLLAASDAGVDHAVCTSSGNVYRHADQGSEEDAAYPVSRASYYLGSKLVGELWAMHLDHVGAMRVSVLRPSAVYGPTMKGGVVRLFATRIAAGQPVVLQDGGRFQSDLVYVDDVAAAVISAVHRRASGLFNVGSGLATPLSALASILVDLTDQDPGLVRTEPAGDGPAAGFPAMNIDKAKDVLDYRPTPLRDGLRRCLDEGFASNGVA